MGVLPGDGNTGYRNMHVSPLLASVREFQWNICRALRRRVLRGQGARRKSIATLAAGFEIAFGAPFCERIGHREELSERFQFVMKAGNLFFDHVPGVIGLSGETFVDVGSGAGQLTPAT